MVLRLWGREETLFDQFEKHGAVTVQGTSEFLAMVSTGANLSIKATRIKELEHEADVITHRCLETLHRSFSLPLDRRDAYRLISRMDDILDHIESAAERIVLYELTAMRADVQDLAKTVHRASVELGLALAGLHSAKHKKDVIGRCIEINRIENEADDLLRAALVRLFKEVEDPIHVIKWKEIYEQLESATDRCEDAANVIEGLVLEQG